MEESRLQASHVLQSSLQSNGDRRYATPPQQIAAYNRNSVPQNTDPVLPELTAVTPSDDIIYGEDVSHLFSYKHNLLKCIICTPTFFFLL